MPLLQGECSGFKVQSLFLDLGFPYKKLGHLTQTDGLIRVLG